VSASRAFRLPQSASRGLTAGLSWRSLLWGAPALLAFVYLIVLLADFQPVITSINMHGDVVIAPVLARLAGQAPAGSQVLLGHHPWYEEYLFLRATSGLPFYRQLWEVAPMLWTFLGFGILAWAAWRALGGLAALLTTSALLCLGSLGRFIFFAFNWHGVTILHTIVLAAALVWLAPRAAEIGWISLSALAVALGLVSSLPMASDALFPFWALIPMGATAVLMAFPSEGRARWTPIVFAALIVLVSLAGGRVIDHLMRASHVTTIPFPFTFVGSASTAVNFFEQLLVGLMNLGGGGFFGASPNIRGFAMLASGVLILAALVLGLWETRRLAAGRERTPAPRPAGVGGTVALRGPSGEPEPATVRGPAGATPRLAYVSFWLTSLLVQSAAFIGTSVPKIKTGSVRYALADYIAIMALMPLAARRGPIWRIAATAGVCVFALSSIFQLVNRPYDPYGRFPGPPQAEMVLRFARAHDVSYGFASYFDGPDLTWLTKFKLQIYPVSSGCGPQGVCATHARIDRWYRPRPGTRSMLIADTAVPGLNQIPPGFPHPLAIDHIGSLTVAVYPFDIASRL
jgi:hypothetical protein